jgi:hypothetical protein
VNANKIGGTFQIPIGPVLLRFGAGQVERIGGTTPCAVTADLDALDLDADDPGYLSPGPSAYCSRSAGGSTPPSPERVLEPNPSTAIHRIKTMDETDADRLELLDRIAKRIPDLDLDAQSVEWRTLDDGHEALLVNGGGLDGGNGVYFANAGEDLHAVGSLAPILDGWIGCIVIKPDGSCYVAQAMPDPLGQQKPD